MSTPFYSNGHWFDRWRIAILCLNAECAVRHVPHYPGRTPVPRTACFVHTVRAPCGEYRGFYDYIRALVQYCWL